MELQFQDQKESVVETPENSNAFMGVARQNAMAILAGKGASPRELGRQYHADIGAESNPVKDIAIGFILIAVSLVIALTMLPIISSAVADAQADPNISASDATLLGLITTMLIVGLLAGSVAFLFRAFKNLNSN